jgi:hypothetical protein
MPKLMSSVLKEPGKKIWFYEGSSKDNSKKDRNDEGEGLTTCLSKEPT